MAIYCVPSDRLADLLLSNVAAVVGRAATSHPPETPVAETSVAGLSAMLSGAKLAITPAHRHALDELAAA